MLTLGKSPLILILLFVSLRLHGESYSNYNKLCIKAGADLDCRCPSGIHVNPFSYTCEDLAKLPTFFKKNEAPSPSPPLKEELNFKSNLGAVVKGAFDFQIGPRWSAEIREQLFGGKAFNKTYTDDYEELLTVNNPQDFKIMASIIGEACKNYYKDQDVMSAISCVVHSVNLTFKTFKRPEYYTFCRAHATAFMAAFMELNLPHSRVIEAEGSTNSEPNGHLVSRFFLTSKSGQVYSYIIDVGNYPTKLFPANDNTEKWHQTHNGERQRFPDFSFEDTNYSFKPNYFSNDDGREL